MFKKMKKFLLLLVLSTIFNSSQAQVASSCMMPPLLANEYKRDITQLAVERLFQLQSPDTALVKVPPAYVDTISEGLAAIFNATSIPERDSVFNMYCVHNLNPFAGFGMYSGLLIKVDTNFSWTSAWQNLITITGDPLLDTLLTKYNLTITHFYNWAIGNYAVLSVDSSWNLFALMDSINMVAGVLTVEQNSFVGVAGKISYSKIGDTKFYDFYFEYADCFDGCDAYRKWKFKVNLDCSVEYLGFDNWCFWDQLGTLGLCPFPAPINCNTFTTIEEINVQKVSALIFPNPANNIFHVQIIGLKFGDPASLEIYNIQGELIYKSIISNHKLEIDLGNNASGIYFAKIYAGQTILTKKIVIH